MTIRTFALAAALMIVPASAFAGSTTIELKYDDLDLSTPQGMAQLDKRVHRAAKEVCTTRQITTGSIRQTTVDQKCYKEALAKLQDQMAALNARKQQG
jgi:UrcA family protein